MNSKRGRKYNNGDLARLRLIKIL